MNNGYREYARLAYKRTILAASQRFIQEHLSGEIPATRQLICEEVLASDRETPSDAFQDYLEELQQEEQHIRVQMMEYEFIRRNNVSRKQEETAPSGEQPKAPENTPSKP